MVFLPREADTVDPVTHMGVDPSAETAEQRFVIRLFVDRSAEARARARWHGHIEDVLTKTPYSVRNLQGMSDFLIDRLAQLGVAPGLVYRLRRRLGYVRALDPILPSGDRRDDRAAGDRA